MNVAVPSLNVGVWSLNVDGGRLNVDFGRPNAAGSPEQLKIQIVYALTLEMFRRLFRCNN